MKRPKSRSPTMRIIKKNLNPKSAPQKYSPPMDRRRASALHKKHEMRKNKQPMRKTFARFRGKEKGSVVIEQLDRTHGQRESKTFERVLNLSQLQLQHTANDDSPHQQRNRQGTERTKGYASIIKKGDTHKHSRQRRSKGERGHRAVTSRTSVEKPGSSKEPLQRKTAHHTIS